MASLPIAEQLVGSAYSPQEISASTVRRYQKSRMSLSSCHHAKRNADGSGTLDVVPRVEELGLRKAVVVQSFNCLKRIQNIVPH